MAQTKLFDKVYGAVMGFAAGDALGVPVEEMHYKNIKSQYGQIRKMLPVTPRLLGGSLSSLVRQGSHPLSEANHFFGICGMSCQICSALDRHTS